MKEKNKKKIPLTAVLSFSFLGFTIVLLIALWLLQTVFLDDTYKAIKTTQVKACANSITQNIDNENLKDFISDIQDKNDMAVSIYDVSSNIIEPILVNEPSSTGIRSYIKPSDVYNIYNETKEEGGSKTIITKNSNIGEFVPSEKPADFPDFPQVERRNVENLALSCVKTKGDTEYLLIVESEITPVTSVVNTLRNELVIVTIVLVILSIIVALVTSKFISKPIKKTNENAKELAKQNYNINFGDSNYKEISELNDTLTYASKELGKVDTLRRELIANVSHDLRTPLTMITGYSEVIRDIPGENTKENVQVIIDESNRLSALVSDLLDISKLESGELKLQKNIFSITDCIKEIIKRYDKLKINDHVDIEFVQNENVYVEADELRITQVIYNLLNNAINYIGEDNKVIIKQSVKDNLVKIEIIDHGEGIEKEELPYIWDRYYKVDKEHKRAIVGTGLGLSIVKNILVEHNSDFGVISEKGKGSNFFFTLPISIQDNVKI